MAHSSLRLKPERPTKIKPENGDSCSGTHFDIAGFGVKAVFSWKKICGGPGLFAFADLVEPAIHHPA